MPQSEAARRREWLKLPRAARIAVRRLHQEFGHTPRSVLVQILKASKAPQEYIAAAKSFVCGTASGAPARPYEQSPDALLAVHVSNVCDVSGVVASRAAN